MDKQTQEAHDLRRVMEEKGFSTRDVAAKVDVGFSTVARFLRGEGTLSRTRAKIRRWVRKQTRISPPPAPADKCSYCATALAKRDRMGERLDEALERIAGLEAAPAEEVVERMAGTDAEIERILAMSDEEVLATSTPEEMAWATGFKEGLAIATRMSARVGQLTEALKPFVGHYDPSWMDQWPDDAECSTFSRTTFGELRAALAALSLPTRGLVDER